MYELLKFFPLIKVDEATHTVWGLVTSETPDSDDEICDYNAAKDQIKKWSDDTLAKTTAAGQDQSLGNMRVMHQMQVGGKALKIEYKDDVKQVWIGSEPADDAVWHLLKGGFLTGHSIGGSYLWKRTEGKFTRYAPTIAEVSYVDRPANPDAGFSYVKADGTTELRKFQTPGDKEKAILHKFEQSRWDADLDTVRKDFRAELQSLMRQIETSKRGDHMKLTEEQLKKAADAIGIPVEEFKKTFGDGSEPLNKAKGMAAVHEHLSAMQDHHAAMHKAHAAMGSMHEKMSSHIEKCMKACKNVMGSEAEADKAIKDLRADLNLDDAETVRKAAEKKAADEAAAAANADKITKADADKQIAEAVKKAKDELEESFKKLSVVPRAGDKPSADDMAKVSKASTADPFANVA